MTVIAWDGKTLAADKRCVIAGGIVRTVTKISRHGNSELIGYTGELDVGLELKEWYCEGADKDKFPASARKHGGKATLIVLVMNDVGDAVIESYSSAPFPVIIEAKRCAWGSGRDYAEAAMHLGEDAEDAVRLACHFQSDCGNGVDTLAFD